MAGTSGPGGNIVAIKTRSQARLFPWVDSPRWAWCSGTIVPPPDPSKVIEESRETPFAQAPLDLAVELGLSRTAAQLLWCRGLKEPQRARSFLEPRLSQLTPPDSMADRAVAAERLSKAIRGGEVICVFGDYDCDGITSAAIMTHALRLLKGKVEVLLANRFDGGYGVSLPAADRILAKQPVAASYLRLRLERRRKPSRACVQRRRNHCHRSPFGSERSAARHRISQPAPARVWVRLQAPRILRTGAVRCRRPCEPSSMQDLDLHAYLDLVAVGTIADVAPLDGDNRILVRAGLRRISRASSAWIVRIARAGAHRARTLRSMARMLHFASPRGSMLQVALGRPMCHCSCCWRMIRQLPNG